MHLFNMPTEHYNKLLDSKRIFNFTRINANSFFGMKKAALFLRTTPIIDTQLYVSDPGYSTNLCEYFPVYMGSTVMLGYLILNKSSKNEFIIEDRKVIIRRKIVHNDTYEKGFVSKQIILLQSNNTNLFLPSVKYLD